MKKLTFILTIFVGLISACSSSDNKANSNSTPPIPDEVTTEGNVNLESEYPKACNDSLNLETVYQRFRNDSLNLESAYLEVRNVSVRFFNNISENHHDWTKTYKQDADALLFLEKILREILKDSGVDSVVQYGKINLETLQPDLGYGMLDGLVLNKYSQNQLEVFVTSKGLFFDYFKSQQINSIQNLTSRQLSEIFCSLISGARATVYFSENISSSKNSQVYGCIGKFAQDIGPFPPDRLFVLISDEDYIYIIQKHLDRTINEIFECKAIYDSIYFNSRKYYDIYRASNRKDTSAFNKAIELEETAWNSYHECYQKEFESNKQYKDVQQQIERIVDYIVLKNSR